MKLPSRLLLLAFSTPVLAASDVPDLLAGLNADAPALRQEARNDLYNRALTATDPRHGGDVRALETDLLSGLSSDTVGLEGKIYIARLLALIGNREIATELHRLSMLPDLHPELRDHLIQALSAIPGQAVSKLLLHGLTSAPPSEQSIWWQALGHQATVREVPAMVQQITSGQANLSPSAIGALGQLGGPEAVAFLFAEWLKGDPGTAVLLESALLQTTACPPDQLLALLEQSANAPSRLGAFHLLLETAPEEATTVLAGLLSAPTDPLRYGFIAMALADGPKACWDTILDSLEELNGREQGVVIAAIGDQEIGSLEPVVLDLVQRGDASLQQVALRTLAAIGTTRSVPLLREWFVSGTPEVQEAAGWALSSVKDAQLDQSILEIVAAPDHPDRRPYLQLMALRNPEGAVALLNERLWNEFNAQDTDALLSATEEMGDIQSCRILLHLIARDDPVLPTRKYQIALKRLTTRLAIDDFLWDTVYLPALENAPTSGSKARIIEILDGIPNEDAMAFVTTLLKTSSDRDLAAAARVSARRWPDINIGEYWIGVANDRDASADETREALSAIARLATSDSVNNSSYDKAKFALKALTSIWDEEKKQPIIDAVVRSKSARREMEHLIKPYAFVLENLNATLP